LRSSFSNLFHGGPGQIRALPFKCLPCAPCGETLSARSCQEQWFCSPFWACGMFPRHRCCFRRMGRFTGRLRSPPLAAALCILSGRLNDASPLPDNRGIEGRTLLGTIFLPLSSKVLSKRIRPSPDPGRQERSRHSEPVVPQDVDLCNMNMGRRLGGFQAEIFADDTAEWGTDDLDRGRRLS